MGNVQFNSTDRSELNENIKNCLGEGMALWRQSLVGIEAQ